MKRVYLSIDLDYWRHFSTNKAGVSVTRFFKQVFALKKTVAVALHHHHLLEHINRCKALTDVINVDFHSDLQELNEDAIPMSLGEGSWANFVNGRERMTYTWRYPSVECITASSYDEGPGYCHGRHNPFTEPTRIDWRQVKMGQGIARLPWDDICAVGVCLSPYWIGDLSPLYYPFEELQLYEWYARWQESQYFDGHNDCMKTCREKGEGKAKLRLHRPCCVL